MTGHHDLGGRRGFGRVPVDDDAVFHDAWEARTFAVASLCQGAAGFNTDAFRHTIERIPEDDYFGLGYFGRWERCAEMMATEGGILPVGAVDARLDGRQVVGEAARTTDAAPHGEPWSRREPPDPPRFAVGDRVRVLPHHSTGHTRRPAYVQGRTGTVERVDGGWIFPDTHAHGRGEHPTWVYGVAFRAPDLFAGGHERDIVVVDLFEPYLEDQP